ncbi:NAD(P)H-dependent amine dehydrogenase family protein [Nocardia goodfellowii]
MEPITLPQTGIGPSTGPTRVVQWATGNIGARALRAVIEHPHLALAGVYVHNPEKDGLDAGELCGLGPTGVVATSDVGHIVDLDADCVLYMPRACDMDEVSRLLTSGANIVTTRGEFHHPASMDPLAREQIEVACRLGAASIHSTGISPGFITEAVPLVLASIQRELRQITIDEYADLSHRDSPGIVFDVMGFGKPPAAFDERRLAHIRASFAPSIRMLADTIGVPLDTVEIHGEVATSHRRLTIAAGVIEPGTIAAQRITVSGRHEDRTPLRFRATWYCDTAVEPRWEIRDTGWHLTVDGDVPLDVQMRLTVPLERMSSAAPSFTANRAVNAVAAVCAAAPGIRTIADLPHITTALR